MNRLYYVWTTGYGGATGESPSGPSRQGPFLAPTGEEALAMYRKVATSWDGAVKKVTHDEDYAPRKTWKW